jgi:glyoxylase-like metal-dependent hydrolase (beta-lactamase superfamily II)
LASEARYQWADPGLEEVAEGVYRCPLPLPGDALRAVNSYLVRSDRGYLMVDCGWDRGESRAQLADYLRRLGADLSSVQAVFATHCHWDHLGAAGWVRDESGAWVTLGWGDRETATASAEDPERSWQASLERLRACSATDVAERLLAERTQGSEELWHAPLPDVFLVGAELLRHGSRQLEVLATPGHTRGHLCLFDRAHGLLFAGDHVLPQITPSLGVELPLPGDSPLASFLSSLELVRDLPATTVLPAHGPTFVGLRDRVDELLEHHRLRLQACLELVGPEGSSAREVAGRLPWTRRRRRFQELDGFNQMLAVFESDAHLMVLLERGRLRLRPGPGETRYLRVTGGPSGPRPDWSNAGEMK